VRHVLHSATQDVAFRSARNFTIAQIACSVSPLELNPQSRRREEVKLAEAVPSRRLISDIGMTGSDGVSSLGEDPAVVTDELLRKMCRHFQTFAPGCLGEVTDALRERTPRLREAAHKLGGMVSSFSATAAEVAALLGRLGSEGKIEEATQAHSRLSISWIG
jgi:HPt (histidine-containing phosphotransfer) domain-containing protein